MKEISAMLSAILAFFQSLISNYGVFPGVMVFFVFFLLTAGIGLLSFFAYVWISKKFKKEVEPEYSMEIKSIIKINSENIRTVLYQIAHSQTSSLAPEQVDVIIDKLYQKAIALDTTVAIELLYKQYVEDNSFDLKKMITDILIMIVTEYDDLTTILPKSFNDSMIDLELKIESVMPLVEEIQEWITNDANFATINDRIRHKLKYIVIKWKKR